MVLMNLFARQEQRLRHREQTYGHSGERRGWENRESSSETYTLPYVKHMASGKLYVTQGSA